jgi:LysM repeat protein
MGPGSEVDLKAVANRLLKELVWLGVCTVVCGSLTNCGLRPLTGNTNASGAHFTQPPVYAYAENQSAPPQSFASAPNSAITEDDDVFGAPNVSSNARATTPLGEDSSEPEDEVLEDDEAEHDDAHDHAQNGATYAGSSYSPAERQVPSQPHPLASLNASDIRARLQREPATLGPMSIGAPNGGALMNAVQLPADPRWERVAAGAAWGTQETIDYLESAIGLVADQFPNSLPVAIGHISDRNGGPIRPHRSHQSGADVDVGYYYKPEAHRWYQRATRENLDLARTWALVRALITETDVRLILIDRSIQVWLREYAESISEDRAWLDDVFGVKGSRRPALIRHAPGHATHLHVRFYNPIAEETARRCYPELVALGKIKLQPSFVSYKARKGDTLLGLAKRFGTTVKAIKRANALRSNTILAKRVYKIPSAAKHTISMGRSQTLPARRLPPAHSSTQSLSQR